MKYAYLASGIVGTVITPAAFATTASSLGSFGGIEELSAIVHASGSVTQGGPYVQGTGGSPSRPEF